MPEQHITSVGGQALIEGVMMQGPKGIATAVRKPDGEILTEYHEMKKLRDRYKFFNIPIIRGIVGFIESMIMGYKTLMYSAEVSGMEDLEDAEMNKFEKWLDEKLGDKLMGIGYEFIRYAGKHDNLFVRILSAPGLWMQRITTKEPDDDIIECGIAALKAVITDNPQDDAVK